MEETFDRLAEAQHDDELTAKICERLGERQRKLNLMQEWQATGRSSKLPIALGTVLVAACLTGALVFFPKLQPESPLDELGIVPTEMNFRSATSPEMANINDLIANKQYEDALEKVRVELNHSDVELKENFCGVDACEDEELQYAYQEERIVNSEIRWCYICLLVRTENYGEAKKQLLLYIENVEYCEHEEDAKALIKKINKNF